MKTNPLSTEDSTRICKHMNDDHPEALLEFAKYFGGVSKPNKAKMIDLSAIAMKLEVDEQTIEIPFDHKLKDSEDAHRSLVSMLKRSKGTA